MLVIRQMSLVIRALILCRRKLISQENNLLLRRLFEKLFENYFKLMNGYIRSIGTSGNNELNEEAENYLKEMNNDLEDLLANDFMTND